jgi:hypothetical protein
MPARAPLIGEIAQKLLRCDQIGGAETLRKAGVDRLEGGESLGGLPQIAEQPGEARRGAQLARQDLLPAREGQLRERWG